MRIDHSKALSKQRTHDATAGFAYPYNLFELDTNLSRIPTECLVEINNRYVWRTDWKPYYGPFKDRFKFVLSSDAHQPNWLGQAIAQHAAAQLGVKEHLVF
jgi:hypothetical protein